VTPIAWFALLAASATVLAWWPGYVAQRNSHPQAHVVRLAGWLWLFIGIPVLWVRRDWSVVLACAWAVIVIAAYVKSSSGRA
jgi:ABC-type nitrate/sulfonate/bicarbonate transport system substrate-binding protein